MTSVRLAVFLAACSSVASAQTTTPPPSLDPPPIRIGPATLSGYVQADFLKVAGDDHDEVRDTFRIRRARVSVTGDLAPRVAWAVSAELSGTPHLRDGHITVRLAPQLSVRAGQFYPPTALDRLTSTSRLEIIDRARVTEAIAYERNPGVAIMNAQPWRKWVSYSFAVLNGTGMNRADDNDAKDVSARLVVSPPMLAGLSVGVNGATGDQPAGDRRRSGVDVTFERPAFRIVVEGLRETMDGMADREGFYVLGVYRIRPATATPHFRMIELAARLVQLDDPVAARPESPTQSFIPISTREFQFGGNYYVNRNVRFLLNAILPVDDREVPSATLIGRLQVLF